MASSSLIAGTVTLIAAYIAFVVHRLYFDPLSKYPGPKLWALTRLPYMLAFRNGTLAHRLKGFHETYGETVRVAPNELSFISPDSIRDIYNKRPNASLKCMPKDPVKQPAPKPGQPVDMLGATDHDHSRIRKGWSYSFSSSALAAQEPLISSYVAKMVTQLKRASADSLEPIDLNTWYNFCTFDIICSLAFGEDFGCLENEAYHPWVGLLVGSIKGIVQGAATRYYPLLAWLLASILPNPHLAMLMKHNATTVEKVQKRLGSPTERADFLSHLQKSREGMTDREIEVNAPTMIFAGSHTLQTALTGITLKLLENPDVHEKVQAEVRAAASTADDLTSQTLTRLPYFHAVIQEGLRIVSPVPLGNTRQVPHGGITICGEHIPAGTLVQYQSWAATTSALNFADPYAFAPERWLDTDDTRTGRFANDRRHANQPFLQGPRDCIGQNLARVEIALILGCMLYFFDIAPTNNTPLGKWEEQETYAVWDRTPLPVRLTAAR